MKMTLRLIVPLVLVTTLVGGAFSFLQYRSEKRRLTGEFEIKVAVLTDGVRESVKTILKSGGRDDLQELAVRLGRRESLLGIAVYDPSGNLLTQTPGISRHAQAWLSVSVKPSPGNLRIGSLRKVDGRLVHLYSVKMMDDGKPLGRLLMAHNAETVNLTLRSILNQNLLNLVILSLLIVCTTLLVVRFSITNPISQMVDWLKQFRMGGDLEPLRIHRDTALGSLATEVNQIARSLAGARAAAAEEARLRLSAEAVWTPEKLKEHVRNQLADKTLFVISNREPHMHVRQKRKVECIMPASGMVTAIEPVMRACGGVWIAHGSGDADRENCDRNGKVRVPPNEPAYTLKRVWLTKEEETGYYYGFSNEGLWPLCHITHTRPIFRLEDWNFYQEVNQKFAASLLEEIKDEESPLVLIQDYHFALLPLLIRKKRPDARIAIFWHIPWPNPESFGICPWKREIVRGMLGADFIGFHTQYHCNNFLDTVDDTLESIVNWENFSVQRGGHITQVRPFPISVGIFHESTASQGNGNRNHKQQIKQDIFKEYGISSRYVGVGVDRLDYTKGIVERFKAIERFLEKYPEYIGRFTFVELGAPSRTHIQKYHEFIMEVEKTVDEINWKFQNKDWKPILLLKAHHSHADILPFYKAADLCMVTSLHDGMNLVAKEFVATRDDEDGVLILSQFTGASRELRDSLIINPYDTEATAEAIRIALEMPQEERSARMRRMRNQVRERNVYLWAGNLISALSRLHTQKKSEKVGV